MASQSVVSWTSPASLKTDWSLKNYYTWFSCCLNDGMWRNQRCNIADQLQCHGPNFSDMSVKFNESKKCIYIFYLPIKTGHEVSLVSWTSLICFETFKSYRVRAIHNIRFSWNLLNRQSMALWWRDLLADYLALIFTTVSWIVYVYPIFMHRCS